MIPPPLHIRVTDNIPPHSWSINVDTVGHPVWTRSKLAYLLRQVSIRRFAYPLTRLELYVADVYQTTPVRVTVSASLPHRDSGDMVSVSTVQSVMYRPGDDTANDEAQRLTKYLRDMLHHMVMHEVDECLLVDRQRVFDPHADEREPAVYPPPSRLPEAGMPGHGHTIEGPAYQDEQQHQEHHHAYPLLEYGVG